MAIGNPSQVGTNTSQASGQTTLAISGCVIPASSLVIVTTGYSNGGTAVGDPTSVSDGTNNYTKATSDTRTTASYASIWYFYDSAGGTRTITITFPAAVNMSWAYVFTCASASSTNTLDATDNGTAQGGTTTPSSTTSTNIAQADEVAIVCLYNGSDSTQPTTWPPTTGFTNLANVNNTTRGRAFAVAYLNQLTSGATLTAAAGTYAAAKNWVMPMATFKGGGGTANAKTLTLSQGQSILVPRKISRILSP
jgi:hypothetical protein